jgi:hypothetical protein
MESNFASWQFKNQSAGAAVGEAFALALGCEGDRDLDCLRRATTKQVLRAQTAALLNMTARQGLCARFHVRMATRRVLTSRRERRPLH